MLGEIERNSAWQSSRRESIDVRPSAFANSRVEGQGRPFVARIAGASLMIRLCSPLSVQCHITGRGSEPDVSAERPVRSRL
jgi:hypothetical protein